MCLSQSGIVGGMGNFGGIVYAMVFRFHPVPFGKAFWISGIIAMVTQLFFSIQFFSLAHPGITSRASTC